MTPRSVNLDRRAYGDADPAGFEARVISRYHTAFIPWLEGWIGVAANPQAGPRIEWLRYGASHDEIGATTRNVIANLVTEHPQLEPYTARDIAPVETNLVSGDELWQGTPDAVRNLLMLCD